MVYYTIVKKDNINNSTEEAKLVLNKLLNELNMEMPEIIISKTGKPYFKNSNMFFNYSHSKNYIACAVSNYEVGIDIEEKNRKISDAVAFKYLDNVKANDKRIETWVKKEAYSKLKGLGLQIDFTSLKLEKIKEKNIIISNANYICSIYSDAKLVKFINIIL